MNEEREINNAAGPQKRSSSISEDILNFLQENTSDPGEAFILLQQLTIYIWDQFKIDWNSTESYKVAPTRRQRYMDYITQLLDNLKTNNMLIQDID